MISQSSTIPSQWALVCDRAIFSSKRPFSRWISSSMSVAVVSGSAARLVAVPFRLSFAQRWNSCRVCPHRPPEDIKKLFTAEALRELVAGFIPLPNIPLPFLQLLQLSSVVPGEMTAKTPLCAASRPCCRRSASVPQIQHFRRIFFPCQNGLIWPTFRASGGAVSSVVEHHLDTVGVEGSIPSSRTISPWPFDRRQINN